MSRFTVSETIERPVDEVWAFATDWSNAPRWMKGVESIRPKGESMGRGTTLVFVSRGAERESTLAEWDPPKTMALRSAQGGVTATYTYRFEPKDDGTRVTLEATCEFRGFFKLMAPLIGYLIRKTDGGQVHDLKTALG